VTRTTWAFSILICALLALSGAGCTKKAASGPPQTLGQAVAQLRAVLATAGPEVQSNIYGGVGVVRSIHYGQYDVALAALDRIAGNANLNDRQKRVVSDVTELVKQAAQKQQNAPAQ
jgi:hypothetical protein